MSKYNPKFDETIAAKASFIKAAVAGRLPKSEFDFNSILHEQDRRRRVLRGMTTRLHKDWSSLDNERRSAACRFEWARLQIFLAAVVLPIFQRGDSDLYVVLMADPHWHFSGDEIDHRALFSPIRETHKGLHLLSKININPTWVATYAVTGEFDKNYNYTLQPRATVLLSGVSENDVRSAFCANLPESSPKYHVRARAIRIPAQKAGRALDCITKPSAEDMAQYYQSESRPRNWGPMPSAFERVWLRFMAAIPITDMVDFGGFDEPLNWWFSSERTDTLLDALTLAS